MATFDQTNQIVSYQYNADTINNFGPISGTGDLTAVLEHLNMEFRKALQAPNTKNASGLQEASSVVETALAEAKKPGADKSAITGYLVKAAKLISGTVALAGLATALKKAADLISDLL